MSSCKPFLVGAGCLPVDEMRAGSNAIAKAWGGKLIEYSCSDDPKEVLGSLPEEEGLVQLLGDAAMHNSYGGSWLEALGAWRQPIVLMTIPTSSGDLPGFASAYKALCESLSVPLVGIVQIGGDWESLHRRLDGLPWCGWLSKDCQSDLVNSDTLIKYEALKAEEIVLRLRQRLMDIIV